MQLSIEKLVYGGYGLARAGGDVIFLEDALPDEIVEAEIIGEKGGMPIAFPKEILRQSPWYGSYFCKSNFN